ncbi:Lysine/arginine/ornithine-binding periplasmic protein [Pseudomonas reidholzensis]|uniref:Lysine/arginine/ornithine-binding periplasmic protein n=1 Tax=Pseudomonas reidholzensis TaxID=1785162 RepID=A0A383RR95_9PSED|nr:transporter substrate-binding domain-containing protein [Pseudomonas reidholzensis]SYX88981.1 Lysine/arginine/ornithine-binding periplasmic protein [Pseudomonas reidholzensis]
MRIISQFRLALFSTACLLAGHALGAESCTPSAQFKTIKPGSLTVAVYNYPPFTTVAGPNDIGGVDTDVVREIARRNCLTVVPVIVDPSAVIQNVLSQKVDLGIGDWFRTAERAKVLGMSWPLYVDQMAFYSREGFSEVGQLNGKRVGAVSGFLYAGQIQASLDSQVVLYPNPVGLAQDLAAGRLDVAVDSYGTGKYAQSKGAYQGIQIEIAKPDARVPVSVEPAQIALLYHMNKPELGAALDAAIRQLHAEGKIAEILQSNGLAASGADTGEPRLIK